MLVGVYLLIPMLSPWAEKVSKRELQIYLALCLFTTLFPSLRDWLADGQVTLIHGTSGIPRQAFFPLWGECSWNSYGTFYYFSGFIGYLLLGLYLRRFVYELSWRKTLCIAIPCYLVGFATCFGGFLWRVFKSAEGSFPVEGTLDKAVWWETTWTNDTIGVALMAIAWILLFRQVKASGAFYQKVLLPISKASYGIYLSHLFVLVPICGFFRDWLGIGEDGVLGFWTTPIQILLSSIIGFIIVSIVCMVLQRIPKIGKYIIG
jgi:surface polysaccharide O-acyltransferase-like enzyme